MVTCPDCSGTGKESEHSICKTCKGSTYISEKEAEEILKGRELCSKFIRTPRLILLPCIIAIVVMALSARAFCGFLFLSYHFLDAAEGYCTSIIFIATLSSFAITLNRIHKGSKLLPSKDFFQGICILLSAFALVATIIAGPITGSTSVLEYKAKEYLNKKGPIQDPQTRT